MLWAILWIACGAVALKMQSRRSDTTIVSLLAGLALGPIALLLGNRADRDEATSQLTLQRRAGDEARTIYRGHGAEVELREDGLTIKRFGAGSFLTQGIKGEKRIPYSSLTAVQLKSAGRTMSGYIQFSILGGNESGRGIFDATLDENTVMFTPEQDPDFQQLRDVVEARSSKAKRPQDIAPSRSTADELAKLADLHQRGVLNAEEFAAQKARALSA